MQYLTKRGNYSIESGSYFKSIGLVGSIKRLELFEAYMILEMMQMERF